MSRVHITELPAPLADPLAGPLASRRFVLLHGLASGPEDWEPVCARLRALGAQCVAPDAGYLQRPWRSLPELAEALWDELPDAFRDPGTLVAGNSLGGVLALALGERFRRLALVSTHLDVSTRFLGRGRGSFERELARVVHDPATLTPERVAASRRLWDALIADREAVRRLRTIKKAVQGFDYAEHYARLAGRIALICGRHDRISPLADFRDLHRRHPAMRLHVVEDCGHAIPLEQPEALATLLAGC